MLEPERKAALVALRAAALTRDHFHVEIPVSDWSTFGSTGAAAACAGRIFVFPAASDSLSLGAALAWATAHNPTSLDLVFGPEEDRARLGVVARAAQPFAVEVHVFHMEASALVPVSPAPYDTSVPPSHEALLLGEILQDAGCEVIVENGQVIGEIRGLEVARVVEPSFDAGAGTHARIEVGIGRFDREAFALLHAGLSAPEALAQVIAQVSEIRRANAEPHPLNRLGRERWLRSQLIRQPSLVGATNLRAVPSAVARGGLRENAVAVAVGSTTNGTELVVATSTGVNLEAVVDAADSRALHAPEAMLYLVVPPKDDFAVTRRILNLLDQPGQVLLIEGEWWGATP